MADDDSDYELMPKAEIERIKREISALKKNPYAESEKGKDFSQSIDRLNSSINKLIAILEDAQQDIIDEYQEAKPIEKLNQILDQNETIAKALVSINDSLGKKPNDGPIQVSTPQIPRPNPFVQQMTPRQEQFMQQPRNPVQNQPTPIQPRPQFNPQFSSQFNQQAAQFGPQMQNPQFSQSPQQFGQQPFDPQDLSLLPPLEGLNDLPPLENKDDKKKRFLGLI